MSNLGKHLKLKRLNPNSLKNLNPYASKGKHRSDEFKKNLSNKLKGRNKGISVPMKCAGWNKGLKMSKDWKEKHPNKSQGALGKTWKLSEEVKSKLSLAHGGTGIPQRPSKRYYHLRDKRYMDWRSKVFERDSWTCQTCGKRGCYLEPHHIKGWAKYPELRYEVNNGVSLCYECHKLTRKKH